MATQVEQPGNYEFSAQPQPVGVRGKYREESNSAGSFLLKDKSGFHQTEGTASGNDYDPLDEEGVDESQLEPDYYVDRPPSPEFKPKEEGVDFETQIEDYELFDYHLEVEPILQVLVGKTVDQARMELIEEYEQNELKKHKATFEIKRNAELMVTQRMEAAYVRRQEEKERRNWQHKLHRDQEKQVHQKLISRLLIKKALGDVKRATLSDLENQGFLRDEMILKLRANILPWILNTTISHQDSILSADTFLEKIAKLVEDDVSTIHSNHLKKETSRRNQIIEEREKLKLRKEERKRKKELWKQKIIVNGERQLILDQLNEQIVFKAEKIENLKDCEYVDLTGDSRRSNVTSVFGGIIGQLWIAIESINSKQEPNEHLTSEQISILIDCALRDLKHGISVKLTQAEQEVYDSEVKILSEVNSEEDLEAHRQNFTHSLLTQLSSIVDSNPTLSFISSILVSHNSNAVQSFKQILKVLFDHVARSLKPDPHLEGSTERVVDDRNVSSKIRVFSENFEEIITDRINTVVRLRIPFLSSEEMQKKREQDIAEDEVGKGVSKEGDEQNSPKGSVKSQQKIENQAQSLEEKEILIKEQQEEECKYDEFVEVFDGQGYTISLQQNMLNSQRHDLINDYIGGFNLWANESRQIILYDERSSYFIQQLLLKMIKEAAILKLDVDAELFGRLFSEIQEKLFNDFLATKLSKEKLSTIPIFDIDFSFKTQAE